MQELILDLPESLAERLASVAQATGQSEPTLIVEALRVYLDRAEAQADSAERPPWHAAAIAEGLADIEVGRHTDLGTVKKRWAKHLHEATTDLSGRTEQTSSRTSQIERLGFMKVQISVPDDFYDIGSDEIKSMFDSEA